MAYTSVTPQTVLGAYVSESAAAQMTTFTFTAGDATNGNVVYMPGRKMLIMINNTAGGAGTVTITSSDDPQGRTATITDFSVAAGGFAGRIFEPVGWEQTLGGRDIVITPSATTMEILAIPL